MILSVLYQANTKQRINLSGRVNQNIKRSLMKSSFYRSISQGLFVAGILGSYLIVKVPLLIIGWALMLLIAAQQLITYKQLHVIENKTPEDEAAIMIRRQKMVVRIIQIAVVISAILIASQTFHKMKF